MVTAETLTGTLGGSTVTVTSYVIQPLSAWGANQVRQLVFMEFEKSSGLSNAVIWPTDTIAGEAGMPIGAATEVTYKIGTTTIGTGTIGYQIVYNNADPPVQVEASNYVWFTATSWNTGSFTGTQRVNLTYDNSSVYSFYLASPPKQNTAQPGGGFAAGNAAGTAAFAGTYNIGKADQAYCYYSVEKPAGLGIQGVVTKSGGNSRIYVENVSNNQTITSEGTFNANNFSFSTTAQSIKIGLKTVGGRWYNSTSLFSIAAPTPTPTATYPVPPIDPYNPPLPAGYIRTRAECVDPGGSRISGCDIQLKDVQNNTWSNKTASLGYWFIDTLPDHTINAYGQKTGYRDDVATGAPASSTYTIKLFLSPTDAPTAPSGYVKLYILTEDSETAEPVDAMVEVRDSKEGYTEITRTRTDGEVEVTMSNLTLIYVTATASGYVKSAETIMTTDFGPDTLRISMHKATIATTPIPTPTPPGWTPAVTPDPAGKPGDKGYSNAKGQEMLDWMAQNGMAIVQVCFLVTFGALLGFKFGK